MDSGTILLAALIVIALGAWLYLRLYLRLDLWLAARAAGMAIPFSAMVAMRFRHVNPETVIQPGIVAHKAGLQIALVALEAHALAGGNPSRVVNALVMARARDFPLSFEDCAALDLSEEDPAAWVKQQTTTV